MVDYLHFSSRSDFRSWLEKNGVSSSGVWLLFGKHGGPKTLKASEALEEALCFGWIDGQIQRIDDKSYIKYFSERRPISKWSAKNKTIVQNLENQGIMTEYGREKINAAKQNGQWDNSEALLITDEHIAVLSDLLKHYEPAYTNFKAMSPSVQKTYTKAYFDAKTDTGRSKRILWIVERLNKNLKPM